MSVEKRSKLDILTEWCHAELDSLTAGDGTGSIASMIASRAATQTTIDTITAIAAGSRTTNQRIELAQARAELVAWNGRIQAARRWVRLAKFALLLDGSRARTSDLDEE